MAKIAEIQIELQATAMREGLRTFEPGGSALLSMIDLAMAQSREAHQSRIDERADRFGVAAGMGMARANSRPDALSPWVHRNAKRIEPTA
jgi:hypothetical protein